MSNYKPTKVEIITAKYMLDKALSNERRYDIFHPSAWGGCLRKIAFQYYNEKYKFFKKTIADIDLRLERVFDNGHHTHERWQEYLAKSNVLRGYWKCKNPICNKVYGTNEKLGILCPSNDCNYKCECGCREVSYKEMKVISDKLYNFEGSVDAIIDVRGTKFESKTGNDVFVVDFKTINDTMYSDLQYPKWEHVVQTNIYMWLLELEAAVVVYENKDRQTIKEMFVPRDESIIKRIKEESKWLVEVLKNGKLPKIPIGYNRHKFPCSMCEFSRYCHV